jgi:hypothetical protein
MRPGIPNDLYPSGFETKMLYAFLMSVMLLHPRHFVFLDSIALIFGEEDSNLFTGYRL